MYFVLKKTLSLYRSNEATKINNHNIMKTVNIFAKFDNLNGAKFIGLNSYESKGTGEISNYVLTVNISEHNMKVNDLAKLKSLVESDFLAISQSEKIALDIVKLAFGELVFSAEKNLSENPEDRTVQSQAQTDAYEFLTKGVKLNKTALKLHVCGLEISKEVIVKGVYKVVKSSDKTLAKKAIQKYCKLSCLKYRNFIFENIDQLKITGTTIDLK